MEFYDILAFKNLSTDKPLFLINPRSKAGANSLWFGIDKVGLSL